ncbi:MAG: PCYCGC motif-containing (lipo)protein [Bacillaceae bacterium]
MKRMMMLLAVSAVMIVSGCSSEKAVEKDEHAHKETVHINQEETKGIDQLPSFLEEVPEVVMLAYKSAAQTQELLDYIPCYCGCGESVGHKDNLDCFIKEVKKDGTVVWDDHAITCENCVQIALESGMMHSEGKSAKEIRTYIDNKFNEGYGTPTPTEMPAS